MKTGDKAKLAQPVIQGFIIDTEYDKEKEQLRHLLEYTNSENEVTQRWFAEDELEDDEDGKVIFTTFDPEELVETSPDPRWAKLKELNN